jgi:prepilin-type N-terminal cleavage/methylation domain-containing protein
MKYDKKGFTLIELVVVMVLTAIIFSMGFAIYRFSTGAYQREAQDTLTQADLRTAISVITKDIRKHPEAGISASGSTITVGGNTYNLNGNSLEVNGSVFITDIKSFNVSSANSGKTITIQISGMEDKLGKSLSYETTITRR